MRTKLLLEITGHLQVKSQKENEPWAVLYDEHNAIDPNHLNIVRKALAGLAGARIGNIKAYNGGTLLATAMVGSSNTPVSPLNVVEFLAEFSESSFNGTLDEFKLEAVSEGIFSYVDNLSIYKDNQTKLAITWKLTINSI